MIYKHENLLPIIAGIALAIFLSLSAFLFVRYDNNWHRYVLFFPKYTSPDTIEGEIRKVRLQDDREENISSFIHELILGPADVRYLNIMPENGDVNTVLLRGNELFVDFSYSILFSDEQTQLTLKERFALLSKSIKWNFSDITKINYTINGEVPVDIMVYLTENIGEEKKK